VTSRPSWHESPPPTSATPRTDRATFGTDWRTRPRILGVPFMGWQSLAADRAMEHDGGQLAYREVDLSIDRQAGMSTLILAVAVRRMWRHRTGGSPTRRHHGWRRGGNY
jgi:hypothetical protein